MAATYFANFTRDNGLPVTVEYSARGGEPNFDYPGHICDGGGSAPEILILKAWPDTPGHNCLASIELRLWLYRRTRFGTAMCRFLGWPLRLAMRFDEWWRASLTDAELERFESWLAEHYVEDSDEMDFSE